VDQATGNRQQATGNRQQATGNRQQATGNYTPFHINRVNHLKAYIHQHNYLFSFFRQNAAYAELIKPTGIVQKNDLGT